MKPTINSSSYIHENPWYKIRKDELTWPNGKPGQFFVAEFPGSTCIICIHNGSVLTVTQHRHTIDRTSIELPMGGRRKDEEPIDCARRELREEAGIVADSWKSLGSYFSLNGATNMEMHVFLAQDISEIENELDDGEIGLVAKWMPITDWNKMIQEGSMIDGESLAAWMLYVSKEDHR